MNEERARKTYRVTLYVDEPDTENNDWQETALQIENRVVEILHPYLGRNIWWVVDDASEWHDKRKAT